MLRLSIMQGDITTLVVDAIVNAAKSSLLGGGGVDGAIHHAAGPELLAECRLLGGCETGKAKLTNGYRLPARYVIHTPGPIWQGGAYHEDDFLASCYRSALTCAAAVGCKTVAFPSISTGVYGFPLYRAAPIALSTIAQYLRENETIEHVFMVCFDERTKVAYESTLAACEA